MARPYRELRAKMSPAAQARAKDLADRDLLELTLQELRKAKSGLTQAQVAELLGVTQGAISQLEQREDSLLSNLSDYVTALGGKLELVAHFPDGDVRITQFESVKEQLAEGLE